MKKLLIISVTSVILISSLWAFANPWEGIIGPYYRWTAPLVSKLNLTEEQSENLKKIHEVFLKDLKPLRDQVFGMRAELKILWEQTDPDRDQILAKEKEIDALQSQIREKITLYRFEMRGLLSDEQRSKMSELEKIRDRWIDRDLRHDHKTIRRH
ncbi:MAG: Spy/CpxP family protein refolding chaperone [Deltaproteobacteria bacterium]|nr:Spy/CpxP family protein refolding chaperone [Deltaproteobacteria bacterium]